jgi:hypothetical protein
MSQRNLLEQEPVEDIILAGDECLTETAFEKYLRGELSQEKLEEAYRMLSEWRLTGEKILELIR